MKNNVYPEKSCIVSPTSPPQKKEKEKKEQVFGLILPFNYFYILQPNLLCFLLNKQWIKTFSLHPSYNKTNSKFYNFKITCYNFPPFISSKAGKLE